MTGISSYNYKKATTDIGIVMLDWLQKPRIDVSITTKFTTRRKSSDQNADVQENPSIGTSSHMNQVIKGDGQRIQSYSLHTTLRANPYPEVTDLICRLPLPTLIYTPKAANLGDLMRLSVRSGVWIKNYPSAFQGQVRAHQTLHYRVLYLLKNPFSS